MTEEKRLSSVIEMYVIHVPGLERGKRPLVEDVVQGWTSVCVIGI